MNPRNVILVLKPRQATQLRVEANHHFSKSSQQLFFVGTLTENYQEFESLRVLRESHDHKICSHHDMLEAYDFLDFTKEYIE